MAPRFITRTGARDSPWSSVMAGRSMRTPWKTKCFFWPPADIVASRMTGAAMADRASPGMATKWTPTPTTSPTLVEKLDLKNAIHVGHSTGGGEVARYIGRHGTKRVAKAGAHRRGAAAHAEDSVRIPAACRSRLSTRSAPAFWPTARSSAKISARRSTAPTGQAPKFRKVLRDSFWLQGMLAGHKASLRLHQGLFRNRLHRRPQEVRRAHPHPARR